MRITAIAALCVASLLANPIMEPDPGQIGMGVLMIWPTARSTALAGAMTGLADEADATYFNPAGLAFQTTAKADLGYGNWLPGLYQGMYYASAAGGAPVSLPLLRGRNAFIAGSLTYMTVGETDIVDEHGSFLGRVLEWRGAAGAQCAIQLTDRFGVGVGMKLAYSRHGGPSWWWSSWSDELVFLGMEPGGNAATVAADIGLTYRPVSRVSVGLAVTNIGPKIHYRPDYGDSYTADLPRTARLGVCWTPVENRYIRLNVMPELNKVLVGMFYDPSGREPFNRMLRNELRDIWKAIGVEATAFNIVSLRLGYFEDLTNQRGGIVLEKEGQTYHYGLWDALTGKNLGEFKSLGLCWGMGFGTDKLRFDFSSDAAIYDFPTSNWKFQLVSNDIGGLIQRLR